MPGFELKRFVNLNKTEQDELSCGICSGIFIKPLVTPCCRQTYCEECIKEWLNVNSTCPNDKKYLELCNLIEAPRLVHNMLNKLQIRCDYIDKGCNEFVDLDKLSTHLNLCRYNLEGNCRECGVENGVIGQHNCVVSLLELVKCKDETIQENKKTITSLEKKINGYIELCNNLESNAKILAKEYRLLKQSKIDLENENAQIKSNFEHYKSSVAEQQKLSNETIGLNNNIAINKKSSKFNEVNNNINNNSASVLSSANRWKSMDSLQNQNQGKKGRKLTKEDIGVPTNFQHIQHVGWNPNTGFDLEKVDPNLIKFYELAGISEEQLTDEDTRTFIYDFIDKHGGIDAAIEEISLPAPSTRSYLSGPQLNTSIASQPPKQRKSPRKSKNAPPVPTILNVSPSSVPLPNPNVTSPRPSLSPKPILTPPSAPTLPLSSNDTIGTPASSSTLIDKMPNGKQLDDPGLDK